jgi:hypothetical protein
MFGISAYARSVSPQVEAARDGADIICGPLLLDTPADRDRLFPGCGPTMRSSRRLAALLDSR